MAPQCAAGRAGVPAIDGRWKRAYACGVAACVCACAVARADVRPSVQSLACVPGGVAAIPLVREAGDAWPATVPVAVGDFTTQGVVVWLGTRDTGARYWTRSPDQVDVRTVDLAPAGAPPEQTGAVLALVELPSIPGALAVLGQTLEVNWLATAPPTVGGAGVMPWPLRQALDVPDTATPSEYWRLCLVAQRRGEQPPLPQGNTPERLWARHVASLWLAGLERVRTSSAGVHAEIVEALTGTAQDPHLPPPGQVAAWIARSDDLRALLAVLLDASTRPEQVEQSALSWLRASWPVTVWIEADAGDRVRVAVANPTAGEHVLRATWVGSDDTVASALLAPPRSVSRHWIDRPLLKATGDMAQMDRMRPEQLELALGELRRQTAVGPREYAVRPPGLSFGMLAPPLSLADAQSGRMVPVPLQWRTSATVRRRQGRWEVIVDCMRPAVGGASGVPDDLGDEVTLRIGDPESPLRTVRVSAEGVLAVDGGLTDGAAAGFMRWPDRWRARIELPDEWLPAPVASARGVAARPVVLALEREPGAGQPRQTGGLAVPPWTTVPPAVIVDLGAWGGAAAP